MNAVDLTAIGSLVVVVLSTLIVPWWRKRREIAAQSDGTILGSWRGLSESLKQDVSNLREERAADELAHKTKLRELESEYTTQLAAARQRISQLETEVGQLYRQIYDMQLRLNPNPGMSGGPGVG